MIDKPKTVLELLENHPERLVKNSNNIAESAHGTSYVSVFHPSAERWCLMGAIQFIYGGGNNWVSKYEALCNVLPAHAAGMCTYFLEQNQDNFPAIIEKVREAGI